MFSKEKVGKGLPGRKANLNKSTKPSKFILTRNKLESKLLGRHITAFLEIRVYLFPPPSFVLYKDKDLPVYSYFQ